MTDVTPPISPEQLRAVERLTTAQRADLETALTNLANATPHERGSSLWLQSWVFDYISYGGIPWDIYEAVARARGLLK